MGFDVVVEGFVGCAADLCFVRLQGPRGERKGITEQSDVIPLPPLGQQKITGIKKDTRDLYVEVLA